MFFFLSKVLAFVLSPLTWVIVLLAYGLFAKNEKRKKKSLLASVIVLLVFSNPFLLDEAMRLWEIPAKPYAELKKYDAAIVLGGMMHYDEQLERIQFYRSNDRLLQAVELYKRGYVKKIVFSGGSGFINMPWLKESFLAYRFMRTIGIPKQDILVEPESRNTHENAINTKGLLAETSPNGNFLLVTSGIHMRRAKACFEKAGVTIETYSTDRYSGPRKFELDHLIIPNAGTLSTWDTLIHEIAGYVVYRIMGYV